MMRETQSEHKVDGFTLLFDVLIEKYDLITAAVYGRVWRFSKMRDGVCYASVSKIAQSIGVSYVTALRRLKKLVDEGYLIDQTPELRNAPHTYVLTGKLDVVHTSQTKVVHDPSSIREQDDPSSIRDIDPSSIRDIDPSSIREIDEDTVRNNKKQQQHQQTVAAAVFSGNGEEQKALEALKAVGFQPVEDAQRYAARDPLAALGWARYAQAEDLGGGYVRKRLDEGATPPQTEDKKPTGRVYR
jgi:hypothetical protein